MATAEPRAAWGRHPAPPSGALLYPGLPASVPSEERRQGTHPAGPSCTHLVLAVVLLGVPQHPIAEAEHVLVGGILLVGQFLQPHQRALTPLVTEWSLQDAEDLRGVESDRDSPIPPAPRLIPEPQLWLTPSQSILSQEPRAVQLGRIPVSMGFSIMRATVLQEGVK